MLYTNKCVLLVCICLCTPRDGFKENKPWIFCDKAVKCHQAIKTIHHSLIYIPPPITKYCLFRFITKSACGRQTGTADTDADTQVLLITRVVLMNKMMELSYESRREQMTSLSSLKLQTVIHYRGTTDISLLWGQQL